MKTTKFLIIAIIVFYYSLSEAQQRFGTPSQIIKSASFIYEGKVTQQECFYGKGRGGGILTCSVMQITKIYKGSPEIKIGTIKVITRQGGQVGNYSETPLDSGPWLIKNGIYFIFGKPADSTILHHMPTDNSITLVLIDAPIHYMGKGTAVWDDIKFNTLDSLYSVFKANGLKVQEEQK
jgi:hypothetical protein